MSRSIIAALSCVFALSACPKEAEFQIGTSALDDAITLRIAADESDGETRQYAAAADAFEASLSEVPPEKLNKVRRYAADSRYLAGQYEASYALYGTLLSTELEDIAIYERVRVAKALADRDPAWDPQWREAAHTALDHPFTDATYGAGMELNRSAIEAELAE